MGVLMAKTKSYHPGFQKLSLFADGTFRKTVFLLCSNAALVALLSVLFPSPQREVIYISTLLLFVFPFAAAMAGGMPSAGWRWYACFGITFAAGSIPVFLGASDLYMLFLALSVLCFVKLHGNAPGLLEKFGYLGRVEPAKEISFSILSSAVFVFLSYLALVRVTHNGTVFLGMGKYILYSALCILTYGLFFGVMYGMLARRLLKLRYELVTAILINVTLLLVTWLPGIIGASNPAQALAASFMSCLVTQFTLGMVYYYCRSTRPIIFAYLIYYLYYKSALF